MILTGTWKPYGKYGKNNPDITIQGQELTFWLGVMTPNPRQTTVHFHLEEEHSLRENHCYNIKFDEEEFKNTDLIVHEETIDGKSVVILSDMGMEYDGRGRIVVSSYVREEDYALVNDDFKSLAYKYWNDRPSVPMMQMNPGMGFPMGMMSGMTDMSPSPAMPPSPAGPIEPWDCICGEKQITYRFCPECGMPMSKQ